LERTWITIGGGEVEAADFADFADEEGDGNVAGFAAWREEIRKGRRKEV
jgi:hypothetical protein